MSIFYCVRCDELRDADDGCDEAPNGLDLICVDCMSDEDDLPAADTAERSDQTRDDITAKQEA